MKPLIPAYNEFRFIGICYKDAVRRYDKNKNVVCHIVLCVKSPNKKETNHIPIIAFGELAEKASVLCRNGNKVAIGGYICTQETLDRVTAEMKVRTFFYAIDIMCIAKARKKSITKTQYSDLMELASIDEYVPPKRKS